MPIFKDKTNIILEKKEISYYKLSKLLEIDESYLNNIFKGKNPFPLNIIEKLLTILEVTREEFEGWILADKYSKEVLKLTIQVKNDFPYKRKSVLTIKIDEILQEKSLSRTALAKQINYNQSGLNKMIINKISMSKSVIEKLAAFFEISQDEIIAWILADKYNLKTLEYAILQ